LFLDSGNATGTVQDLSASAMCPQTPPTTNGVLTLGSVGVPQGVGYGLADPNAVEIQLLVKATAAGDKVAQARVCDLRATACSGSPRR